MVQIRQKPKPPVITDARALRSRDALGRAMLELLETEPLDQITIRDIAARADIGYATYFRHYPTKEALLDDVAAAQIDRLIDMTLPVLDAVNSKAANRALCAYVNDHRAVWTTLLTGGAGGTMRAKLLERSREIAALRGDPESWLPTELGVTLAVSSIIAILDWWLRQKKPLSVDALTEIFDRVVFYPALSKAPGRSTAL